MRFAEVGSKHEGLAKRVDCLRQAIAAGERKTEIVPRGRMRGIPGERAPVRIDRLVVSVKLDEREAEVVVELGLIGAQLRRALEQWPCLERTPTLIRDDAKIMQGEWMVGRQRERSAVFVFGGVDVLTAMRGQSPQREVIRR